MSWAQLHSGPPCHPSCTAHCHYPTPRLTGVAGCALGTGAGYSDRRCVHHSDDPAAVRHRRARNQLSNVVDHSYMLQTPSPQPIVSRWFCDMLRSGFVPSGPDEDETWPDTPHFRHLAGLYELVAEAYVLGRFPGGQPHRHAVWILNWVATLEGLNTHLELKMRSPHDSRRPTVDLAIFPVSAEPWLIEWKTDLRRRSAVSAAARQVTRYGDRAGRPCRLIVAGYEAQKATRRDVEVLPPDELLAEFRRAAEAPAELDGAA